MRHLTFYLISLFGASLITATFAWGAEEDRFASVTIKSFDAGGGIKMLEGAGGNIGVSTGVDGTLIVDSQYAPLAGRIRAAVKELGGSGPKYLLNTHYHGDHTGGNAIFGTEATIIAHRNVRARLQSTQGAEASALPTIVFDDRLRLHVNGDAIDIVHLPAGHTDGDSFVWFRNANVVHLGDQFFNGRFPFVDLQAGGTVAGYQRNLEQVLLAIPADAQVIPGHGPLANTQAVAATIDMLRKTQRVVREAMAAGKSLEQIIAQGLGKQWRSWGTGFISEERWIRTLHADAQG